VVARLVSGPVSSGQYESVSVGVGDGNAPALPVGVRGDDSCATTAEQPVNRFDFDLAVEVDHEQVLRPRPDRSVGFGIANQFKVPGGAGSTDHEQRMTALSVGPALPEHIEPQTIDPETAGRVEVAAGPCHPNRAARKIHASSLQQDAGSED
jgi:hypothetical protein